MNSELVLKRIKEVELDLLSVFIDCCEKLNLKYYLMGGTMLGAVRHQGFIPWDDDIDVGMLREDYDRFLQEAPAYLPSYYFLQCRQSEPETVLYFAKLRDSRTTFIETMVKDRNINHGIYIDIFPLDYYPEGFWGQQRIKIYNRVFSLRIRQAFSLPKEMRRSKIAEFGALVLSKIISLRYRTVEDTLIARERVFTSVPHSSIRANYGDGVRTKEIVPAEWYGEGVYGLFEGIPVRLPTEYDKWLTHVYGDYMKLPPKEEQISHHDTVVIDTEKPYTMHR